MALIPGTPNVELQVVTQMELGRRLDLEVWTPVGGIYSISHPEGEASNCWERIGLGEITKYTPAGSYALCQATPSTYYYDSAASVLYVHTSTGGNPSSGTFVVISFFWESIGSDIIEINGIPCEPLLDKESVPSVSQEISIQSSSGSGTSFGTLKYNNAGGYFDARPSAYIYQAKKIKCWIGNKGSAFADFVPYFMGWTGNFDLDDDWFSIEVEDYKLYVP